ncbi:outer membrane protein assembly factor BamE [Plasticicumulans lactativorans]|nr:outer membrane protein assembly factor BamE [Plasticicumulans lactativorans]
MHRILACALVGASLTLGAGCSSTIEHLPVYKIKVRQGNYLDASAVSAVHPGMSRREVQTLLGTPLIVDPLHQGRWDYVYLYRPGTYDSGEAEERRLTVFFDRDVVARVETGS